jgi:pyruvate dehydrogenase E1 component beta subunit
MFKALKAGIQMVTPPHTPVPFSPSLEDLYIPSAEAIAKAARKTMAN